MVDRYDLMVPRKGSDGKTRWIKIGAMFRQKDKDGFGLLFDALPVPDEKGRVRASAFVPRARDDKPDDPIPF